MSNFEYANATDADLLAWEFAAFEASNNDDTWRLEMEQMRWAEAGGYRSGLARPA